MDDIQLAQYELIKYDTSARLYLKERGNLNMSLVSLTFTFKRNMGFFLLQVRCILSRKAHKIITNYKR